MNRVGFLVLGILMGIGLLRQPTLAQETLTREILSTTDYSQGRMAFLQRCGACHTLIDGGGDLMGPNLDGIFDQFTNAMDAREADDLLAADNALIHIRKTLPELFYLSRDVGDGFGECMRAIHYALHNKIEEVPSLTQLQELRFIIRKLKHQPLANIDKVVEWLMALEDADLEISSPVVGMIVEAVDEKVSGENEKSIP